METIASRKNSHIAHLRELGRSREYRRDCGEFVCDGEKLLCEARCFGAQITSVLWTSPPEKQLIKREYLASEELLSYASPLKSTAGPLFSVKMPEPGADFQGRRIIALEGVQDPGNVGAVIRTANALGFDAVLLIGGCADPYNPKAIRATMGAVFRQRVLETDITGLKALLDKKGLTLCGAALSDDAEDLRSALAPDMAVAVGSEGKGLSCELLELCQKKVIIPMRPGCESLNAAVASAIIMWELTR